MPVDESVDEELRVIEASMKEPVWLPEGERKQRKLSCVHYPKDQDHLLIFDASKGVDYRNPDRDYSSIIFTVAPKAETVREAHVTHLKMGWIGFGPHYFVRVKEGLTEAGRPLYVQGAHTFHHNADSIGVMLAGNGKCFDDDNRMTPAQLNALTELIKEIRERFPKITNLYCHNYFNPEYLEKTKELLDQADTKLAEQPDAAEKLLRAAGRELESVMTSPGTNFPDEICGIEVQKRTPQEIAGDMEDKKALKERIETIKIRIASAADRAPAPEVGAAASQPLPNYTAWFGYQPSPELAALIGQSSEAGARKLG
jgi:hypothetical protein